MYVLLCLEAYMLSQLSGIVLHSVCHVFWESLIYQVLTMDKYIKCILWFNFGFVLDTGILCSRRETM